jgi:hypothetical protein
LSIKNNILVGVPAEKAVVLAAAIFFTSPKRRTKKVFSL